MKEQVLRIAKSVRRTSERFYGDPDLNGVCCEVSKVLCRLLKANGFEAEFVVGTYLDDEPNHCWIEFEDQIIDLTHTQFSKVKSGGEKVFLPGPQTSNLFKPFAKGRKAIIYVNDIWTADPEERVRKLQFQAEKDFLLHQKKGSFKWPAQTSIAT